MDTSNKLNIEQEYLSNVLKVLNNNIEQYKIDINDYKEKINESKRFIWSGCSTEELNAIKNDIIVRTNTKEMSLKKLKSFIKMLDNAYFAKIKFKFEDDEFEDDIYIGISNLSEDFNILVYDWRAPISSLFYDYELGNASYKSPNGYIDGAITLKRQFKINKDKIKEMFDTDVEIYDDVLSSMLSSNVTNKMKTIVSTIQKEQNKLIRNKNTDVLLIQGPAGSGKTSVALHRAAYLLYEYKENIKNTNILIFSPNEVFEEYISTVLPNLGEENIYQTGFADYVSFYLSGFNVVSDLNDLYEKIFSDTYFEGLESIKFKFSDEFIKILDKYIYSIESDLCKADIVVNDNIIVYRNEIIEYLDEYLKNYSIQKKITMVQNKIISIIENRCTDASIKKTTRWVKSNYDSLIKNIKPVSLYKKFFTDDNLKKLCSNSQYKILKNSIKYINKGLLEYEDIFPFLYFKGKLNGFEKQESIKHVIIDECQDYHSFHYSILKEVFANANFTILGDLNQSIFPFSIEDGYQSIINIFNEKYKKVEFQKLTKTYRSTLEINKFSKRIIKSDNDYDQISRSGKEPEIISFKNMEEMNNKIINDAKEYLESYNMVVVICKNEKQVCELRKFFKNENFNYLTKKNMKTKNGINIIPSYIAKGLEFDVVLVYNSDNKNYKEEHRNLFYTICTRALHILNIYHIGNLTSLIN